MVATKGICSAALLEIATQRNMICFNMKKMFSGRFTDGLLKQVPRLANCIYGLAIYLFLFDLFVYFTHFVVSDCETRLFLFCILQITITCICCIMYPSKRQTLIKHIFTLF